MTGPTFPPGLRRGPDCQIRIHDGRPSLITRVDRNPYARPLAATAAAVVLTMAFGAPTIVRALAVILCLICMLLFLVAALR
jgi:hypothetical protein